MKKIYLFITLIILSIQPAIAGYLDGFQAEKVSDHAYIIHGPLELPNEKNGQPLRLPCYQVVK